MPHKDPEKRKKYHREYAQKWRKENKEKYKQYCREYCSKNKERRIKLHKKWARSEKGRKHLRLQMLNRKFGARIGSIRALMELGGCCIGCFTTIISELEAHHPFGRKNRPDFMVHVCRKCHHKLDGRDEKLKNGLNHTGHNQWVKKQ